MKDACSRVLYAGEDRGDAAWPRPVVLDGVLKSQTCANQAVEKYPFVIKRCLFFFYHVAPPELEVPEEPVYTAAHSNITSVLGWHCQTPREGAGDSTDATGLSVYKHCCPLLALKQIKPEEIGSGWLHSV